MFGYWIHPSAESAAEKAGILLSFRTSDEAYVGASDADGATGSLLPVCCGCTGGQAASSTLYHDCRFVRQSSLALHVPRRLRLSSST